jgi:hypothetical protein
VYANSWAGGVALALRLDGTTGGYQQIDRHETGGKGLNHMAVLADGSALIGAHVRPSMFTSKGLALIDSTAQGPRSASLLPRTEGSPRLRAVMTAPYISLDLRCLSSIRDKRLPMRIR